MAFARNASIPAVKIELVCNLRMDRLAHAVQQGETGSAMPKLHPGPRRLGVFVLFQWFAGSAFCVPPSISVTAETSRPALTNTVSLSITGLPEPAIPDAAKRTPASGRAPALYNSVRTTNPVVALTFDDGPHATLTPKLLDILARERVHATFFVLGTNVSLYPDIARRIVADGHEIANHSWNHPSLPKVGAERLDRELRRTSEIIEQTTGQKVTMMRPTYGALNDRVQKSLLDDYKLDVILWSVDPRDWKRPGPSVVARRLVSGAHPGAVLLVHDIHPGTIAAMPETIAGLKARGYRFATMSELLAMDDPSLASTNAPAKVEVLPEGAGYR